MFEGLIEKLIQTYFGNFIEGFDKNKLSIGVIIFLIFFIAMVWKFNIIRYFNKKKFC